MNKKCKRGHVLAEVGFTIVNGRRRCDECQVQRETFCRRGHRLADVGVYRAGQRYTCGECARRRARDQYKKKDRRDFMRDRYQARKVPCVQCGTLRSPAPGTGLCAKCYRARPRETSVRPKPTPIRFWYQHPVTGEQGSVAWSDVPSQVFDVAARHGWSQDGEMVGWLYAQWVYTVPALSREERVQLLQVAA